MTADQKFKIHLSLLVFSLIIVLAALFNLKKLLKSHLTADNYPNAIIRGNEFYHPWLGFSIETPDSNWLMEQRTDLAAFGEEDSTASIFSNAQPIVELRHQIDSTRYSMVEVAALRLKSITNARSLAERSRLDFLKYQNEADIEFLQQITGNNSGRYDAAFFVVQSKKGAEAVVWVVTATVRDSLGYIISARVSKPIYENERFAIEKIVASFKLHPLQKHPEKVTQTDAEYKF